MMEFNPLLVIFSAAVIIVSLFIGMVSVITTVDNNRYMARMKQCIDSGTTYEQCRLLLRY